MKAGILIVGSAFLLIVSLWLFFRGGTYEITNYPPKNEKIVAFGDSLVFGYGATEGHDFVSVLGQKLGRKIINLGVSGNTTADGVSRMNDVLKEDPGVVILLLGGNDYLRRVGEETTRTNLGVLIGTFQAQGAVVVLLGVRGGIIQDGREQMFAELGEEYGAIYISNVLEDIFLKPELMFDGIHPNDAGYAIIADRIHKVFLEQKL